MQLFAQRCCANYHLPVACLGCRKLVASTFRKIKICCVYSILGDPGAASRDDGIFMGERLQQERESLWALTLTERVPEAFEIPPSDWPEKEEEQRNSRATLMSSYTRLFSSSNAVVAWPVQREHF